MTAGGRSEPLVANDRLGSNPEVRGHFKIGPLCGLERTLKREMSGYRPRAVVREGGSRLPFIATTRPYFVRC